MSRAGPMVGKCRSVVVAGVGQDERDVLARASSNPASSGAT